MSSAAFTFLDTRELKRRMYELLNPFTYLDATAGHITAHKGFQTNYASIDLFHNLFLFVFYALLVGYGDKAATIHDYLYTGYPTDDGQYLTRKEIDGVFYRALRAEGVAKWRAWMFYAGVRVGGRSSFYTERLARLQEV